MDSIRRITQLTLGYPTPVNGVDDAKVTELAASMAADGWVGAPIVVDGDIALTGSHRLAARIKANLERLPVVDVSDLCTICGLNWDAILEEHDYEFHRAAIALSDQLPADVVAYLGYDLQ